MNPIYRQARFLTSAARLSQAPPDRGIEVAFAGRSNAGKSSAINALVQQKQLARTSRTPGRTQLLNFFMLDERRRLVDLPGYGYAKVPDAVKEQWQREMAAYLAGRKSLKGLVLLMDIRHPLKPYDRQMLEWAGQTGIPVHILLTKADKLKPGAANIALIRAREELENHPGPVGIQLFSALRPRGIDQALEALDRWFEFGTSDSPAADGAERVKKDPGT